LFLGAVFALAGFQILVLAFVADLIAAHRTVTQRVFERVRRIELALEIEPSHYLESKDDL